MKKIFQLLVLIIGVFVQVDAHPSYGIVVDKYQNIYFAGVGYHGDGAVWKLSKDGKLTILFKNFHCHYLMLDKDHNLLAEAVIQTGVGEFQGFVLRYKQNGKVDTLRYADGYVSLKGNLYQYERNGFLYKTNEKGVKIKHSTRKLKWVQSIYVDDEENVYLPDKGVHNGILLKIDKHGRASVIATDLIAKLNRPRDMHQDCMLGVTKGCDNQIYLAETAGRRILKILDNQKHEVFYKSSGRGWAPTGVAFFSGDAYILEYKISGKDQGPRIVKIDEFDKITLLFSYEVYHKLHTK